MEVFFGANEWTSEIIYNLISCRGKHNHPWTMVGESDCVVLVIWRWWEAAETARGEIIYRHGCGGGV